MTDVHFTRHTILYSHISSNELHVLKLLAINFMVSQHFVYVHIYIHATACNKIFLLISVL